MSTLDPPAAQATQAVFLGLATVYPWSQTEGGGRVILYVLLSLQLLGMTWSALPTANDRIEGCEKCVGYALEAAGDSFPAGSLLKEEL